MPVLTGFGWATWGRAELTFLMGVTETAWGFGAFFWMGVWEIHWHITELGLEQFRVRPASSIFQMIAQQFWAGGLLQVAVGIVMLWLSAWTFGLVIVPVNVLLGALALFLGQAALYILWACLCCLAFWAISPCRSSKDSFLEFIFSKLPFQELSLLFLHFSVHSLIEFQIRSIQIKELE